MNTWITTSMISEIININLLLSQDNFKALSSQGRFIISEPDNIRRAILESFDDTVDAKNLKRICTPTEEYILKESKVYYINPKQPEQNTKRIELNIIVDGAKSDLTIIYYSYKTQSDIHIKIYDALTL